ncbi:MAG TPA: DUF397 domain-containing protein [Streptosporangiaceae bacterium]
MREPDLARAQWRKSSHSSAQGQCVEVAHLPAAVAVRDSRHPDGAVLLLSRPAWAAFLDGVKAGRLGRSAGGKPGPDAAGPAQRL